MRRLLALWLCAVAVLCAQRLQAAKIVFAKSVVIAAHAFMVDAGGKWSATMPAMARERSQRVLLGLEARTDTAAHGGCNFVLHVAINGRPLNQCRGRPRLLNKPGVYHLRNYDIDFLWYRASDHGWSTIFGPDFKPQSVVEGHDFDFLWDVTDLVLADQPNTLVITHLQPLMPKWTHGRGKLALRNIALALADAAHVNQAVQALQAKYGRKPKVAPAINKPSSDKVGERPFELVWANRQDAPAPTVTFDDLSDWEVALYDGAAATLTRSRQEQIWGDYVGKVTYKLPQLHSVVMLRPRTPVPIAGEFDCVNLYVYGGKEYFLKAPPHVPTIYVQIEDAKGEVHEISLGSVNQFYWFLQHAKFAPFRWAGEFGWPTHESWGGDGDARIDFPAKLRAILITDAKFVGERTLWLDSLAFYKEQRHVPATVPPAAGPRFPTTPDTILPTCNVKHVNAITRQADAYALTYQGDDGRLCYLVRPNTGTLSDVTVAWNRGHLIQPMAKGGILYRGALAPSNAKLTSARQTKDALETAWRLLDESGAHDYEITYRIRGKTLVVDIEAKDAAAFVFGTAKGLTRAKLIQVPYLTMQPVKGPNVVYSDGLFMLGLLDWYNTNASTFDGTSHRVSATEASFNFGSKYLPLTDGRRNPLRERVFFTASPDFHEVLPNIPNPPSPRLEWASRYVYNMINPPLRPQFVRLMSAYGVDHQFAICWGRLWTLRQGDSYTYRVRPVPGVTYDDVARYAAKVRSYGDVFGLGGGGRDICPFSKRWDESLVALEPDGNWRRGWPGNYVINHDAARKLARDAGTELRQRYGPSVFYFDVGTQPSPWRCANDYNAAVAGAGRLEHSFRAVCDLMLEMRRHHDFIVSEGGHRWMYAGLSEGDYATIPSRTLKYKRPLIVDFDLLKIHPLQHGVGMGYGPTAFYPYQGAGAKESQAAWKREGISRYVAATIAYGHMGCLSGCAGWPLSRTIRYFALVWPLQQQYLTDTVESIRYHNGERFVSTSEALATDAHLKGRVHVRYHRGLDVMVNYNETETWRVTLNGEGYELPPFGFVAQRPGRVLSYVAMRNGQRVDYVESPELIYASAPDSLVDFPALSVHGSALLRKRAGRGWWLVPSSGLGYFRWKQDARGWFSSDAKGVAVDKKAFCREVRLNAARLLPGAAAVQVVACGTNDDRGALVEVTRDRAMLTLRPSPDVARYWIRPSVK